MIKYGPKSKKVLEELTDDWKQILTLAAKLCPEQHDFSLVEGYRPISRQQMLFSQGLTHIDGVTKKGKHNYFPSKAVDIYPYLKGFGSLIPNTKCYLDLLKFMGRPSTELNIHLAERFVISKMSIVTGIIFAAATQLGKDIIWGCDWDNDGNMLDHNFQDAPHHEAKY